MKMCKYISFASSWLLPFRMIFADTILCIRTWAVWNRHRMVGAVLVVVMLTYACVSLFLTGNRYIQIGPPPYPGFRGCFFLNVGRPSLWGQYAPLFVIDLLLFTLMAISALRFYRMGRFSELSFIIHRDGIHFYIYVLLLTGTNLSIASAAPIDLMFSSSPLEDCLHSVFTARIILNIRQAAYGDTELHTSYFESCAAFPSVDHEDVLDSLVGPIMGIELQELPTMHVTLTVKT